MRTDRVDGGITAPRGFRAAGLHCGIKASGRPDLALVVSDLQASAAGVFTLNLAKAAPVLVSQEQLSRSGGHARALVTNSGCANACTGPQGLADAWEMVAMTAAALGCPEAEVLVASTGVIGVNLKMDAIRAGVPRVAAALRADGGPDAARAIMTTDPFPKEAAVEVTTDIGTIRVGGMAKGSGMIEPRMATMLGYLTTDAAIDPGTLYRALSDACRDTFNAITVDGEPSTNDCVFALANGASGVVIDEALYPVLVEACRLVAHELAIGVVRGGEGATKLVSITATGAATDTDARTAARAIANSPLVKTAVHGADPNWGRVAMAIGKCADDTDIDQGRVTIRFGDQQVYPGEVDEAALARLSATMLGDEVHISADLGLSAGSWTVYGCDLSDQYIRINADYTT